LGGQINCSTTIHSRTDVLKILSINDEEAEKEERVSRQGSYKSVDRESSRKGKGSFFKSFRKWDVQEVEVRREPGMEGELIEKLGRLNFKTQVEAFYTAYSKYFVLSYHPQTPTLSVQFYSASILDLLGLHVPNGSISPIYNKDIFRVLSDHSPNCVSKGFKATVREEIRKGKAVSVETGLLTGYEEVVTRGIFGGSGTNVKRVEEGYVCHFTPLKDEISRIRWVVLSIAPKW